MAPQSYTDALLARAPLPPGTKPWASRLYPGGSWGPYVFPHEPVVADAAESSRLYLSRLGPLALADYVSAHRLGGSSGFRRGGPGEGNAATSGVEYSVPAPPGSGYTAVVEYSVTPFGHGDNLLLIDTEASWVTKRLAVETVPGGYLGQLTAFTSLSYAQLSTGPPARPVRTQLIGAGARRLVGALNSLPPAPDGFCMEDVELYSISLHPPGRDRPDYRLQAQSCGYELYVSVNGAPLPPLWGGSCRFVKLLLALVPTRAAGTRQWAANCTGAPMTVTTNPV